MFFHTVPATPIVTVNNHTNASTLPSEAFWQVPGCTLAPEVTMESIVIEIETQA